MFSFFVVIACTTFLQKEIQGALLFTAALLLYIFIEETWMCVIILIVSRTASVDNQEKVLVKIYFPANGVGICLLIAVQRYAVGLSPVCVK